MVMKIVRKLTNPFVIGVQGFVIGAILFTAVQAREPGNREQPAPVSAYQLPEA
jgi:hypothetical protein